MLIYDQTTLAFSRKTELMMKEILSKCGLKVGHSRFHFENKLYPLHIVIFEGSELGHFNSSYYQIGLNKKLIYTAKDSVIRDVVRHEVAHYLTYLHYGNTPSHGKEFHTICKKYGFSPDVSKATLDILLANESKEGDLESEKIIQKVTKLFALAESSNIHEAELATVKANDLLIRHNLSQFSESSPSLYLERLMIQKRKDAKMESIFEIIKHFIVRPVISYGQNICSLEISGTLTNVKLASYIVNFLDKELDRLWDEAKSQNKLSGLRAKNSFYRGLAKGFNLKMNESKNKYSPDEKKALVVVEQNLIEETKIIYKRLSTSCSGGVSDQAANNLGVERGKQLQIRQGVETRQSGLSLEMRQ